MKTMMPPDATFVDCAVVAPHTIWLCAIKDGRTYIGRVQYEDDVPACLLAQAMLAMQGRKLSELGVMEIEE